MISWLALPIRILFPAFLLGSAPATPSINQAPVVASPAVTHVSSTFDSYTYETSHYETENTIYYETILKDPATGQELGRVMFSYNKFNKTGYIARLHIPKEHRKNSHGSKLLKFALKKLTEMKSESIHWQACPFDLHEGQRPQDMLPKLIAFYQRHGGQVLSQDAASAQLAYYPQLA